MTPASLTSVSQAPWNNCRLCLHVLSSTGLPALFVVRVTSLQEFVRQHLGNGKIKRAHLGIQMNIVRTHTFGFSVEQTQNEKILKGSFLQPVLDTHRK